MTDDTPENLRKFLESDDPALIQMAVNGEGEWPSR